MATNRLKLDFSIEYRDDRNTFLAEYLNSPMFKSYPPTEDELETMGNYLLWGKDRATGLNAKQEGLDIETKHGTWDKNADKTESLEGLMESPTFNEASLNVYAAVPTKVKKEVFSREEALKQCPDYLVQVFKDLFREIDKLDLMITFWELKHNKREKEPRENLVKKFTQKELDEFMERIDHWPQYKYLKMRHQLVELRREQYTLRDSYKGTIPCGGGDVNLIFNEPADFEAGIEVLPLGVKMSNDIGFMLFRDWKTLNPNGYSEDDLKKISKYYWKKKKYAATGSEVWIDFRNEKHVYEMFNLFYELGDSAAEAEFQSNLPSLMDTLKFYMERADLTELQREILDMKLRKVKNADIAFDVNKKWKKSYTPNYISTIFTQRIIPKITEAAAYHEKVVSCLFFEEEFKACSCCGEIKLRDADNFTRKARSKDGFSAKCKKCEKAARSK